MDKDDMDDMKSTMKEELMDSMDPNEKVNMTKLIKSN